MWQEASVMKPKVKYPLLGALAGAALGGLQMSRQGYDFSKSEDIYQAIGFLLGFVLFGVFIGWLSSQRIEKDS
jgi:hypothetical protein